ncbi:phosphoglucomutase/phosphomannomutase family protein [bacterium]|nr:phosphoglucomutase/phosphomannomutase family protein [bacterium]
MEKKIKFGTDGWRDIIADSFTYENVRLITFAIGKYLIDNGFKEKGIFIGYDNRFSSEDFALQAGYALSSMGIKIFISKESVPTPVSAFMVLDLRLDGSIMITASHNPPKYNGIKFIPHYGGPAGDSVTREIEKNLSFYMNNGKEIPSLINYNDFLSNIVYVSDFSVYKEKLFKIIDTELIKKSDLKIIVDTMFGAGSKILPEILKDDLNLNIKVLNNYRDAFFGGRLPDPSENNLKAMKKDLLENSFDIGIAVDGDADRFGIIDRDGIYISPNNVIAMILYYLTSSKNLKGGAYKVVRTVATTHLIDEICSKYKINLIETPVGFKHIGREMLNGDVIIGGEESGGLSILGHIPEKDGILADMLLLEIQSYLNINNNGKSLSEYLDDIYKEFGRFFNERIDMEVPVKKMSFIVEYFKNLKDSTINNIKINEILTKDGVKLLLENKSWLLIRASGTEPLIRCYVEAREKEFFNDLKNFIVSKINDLKKII